MGVKSTQEITEEEAIEKFIELKQNDKRSIRALKAEAILIILMGGEELENELERMNDEQNNGEGFESYRIVY